MSLEAQTRTNQATITVLKHTFSTYIIIIRFFLKYCWLFYSSNNLGKWSKKKNCSETALKIVREKVVSLEAQTRTNEAKFTVLKHTFSTYIIIILFLLILMIILFD